MLSLSRAPIEADNQLQIVTSGPMHFSDPSQPQRPDEANPWRDSSLDLERGLDVFELPIDLVLPDLQEPKPTALGKR